MNTQTLRSTLSPSSEQAPHRVATAAGHARTPAFAGGAPRGWRGRWLARIASRLERGQISIITPDGATIEHAASREGTTATLVIHRWRALRRLATGGDIGFARAYIDGDWSSPDLAALIALVAENIAAFEAVMEGIGPIRIATRLRHLLRSNSRSGSRRNIAFHYDLGNDFYSLWLDESMTYSAACALPPGTTLEAAQQAKLARIVELLAVGPGDRVLEIGCGWGALAARIAESGAHVTGLTLSREQLGHAQDSARRQGLSDRVDLRLEDYRDTTGQFDAIVSIEMLEAVGEAYWPTYFARLRACLRPGGRAVLQAITMHEDRFESYRRDTDFIQHYVFPGGMLPTPGIIADEARKAGLALLRTETFADGYAETLAHWRQRFNAAWPAIAALGFDERFRRMWHYYLSYCEAGFRTRATDVGFYVLQG